MAANHSRRVSVVRRRTKAKVKPDFGSTSLDGRVRSKVVSVESYLYRGYGLTLGEALDAQFVRKVKVNRPTQTDWKWRTMAERWGNARVLEPRPGLNEFCHESQCACDKSANDAPSIPSSESSQSQSENESPREPKSIHKEKEKPREAKPKETKEDVTAGSTPGISNKESKSDHHTLASPTHKKHKRKKSLSKMHLRKITSKHRDIKFCRANDKCEDTADLEFDPFDPRMFYTEKICEVKPMYIPAEIRDSVHDMDDIWSQTPSYTKYNEMDQGTEKSSRRKTIKKKSS